MLLNSCKEHQGEQQGGRSREHLRAARWAQRGSPRRVAREGSLGAVAREGALARQGRAWAWLGGPRRGEDGLRAAWGPKLGGEDERLGAAWGPKLGGEDERLDARLMRGREEEDDWFEIQIKGIIVYLHFCRLCLKIPQRLIILSRGSTIIVIREVHFAQTLNNF
ncbi:hypothetical protein VPH35_095879 [Triticum aestivum]